MPTVVGGVTVRNTGKIITPDTRLCTLVYAPSGYGKTTLGATLDVFTKKYRGKPTLFVACEAAEGGGTMSIEDYKVDYVRPDNLDQMRALVAALLTDSTYGGVVLDSASEVVRRFIQPYSLKFPAKVKDPRRDAGVPVRDDYQTMGEEMRRLLNQFICLTAESLDPRFRKDLMVTALLKEKTDDSGNLVRIGPDLPGALSEAATAMFQTVGTIRVKSVATQDPATKKVTRTTSRVLATSADGVWVLKDRTRRFPVDCEPNFVEIYEKGWLPTFEAVAA